MAGRVEGWASSRPCVPCPLELRLPVHTRASWGRTGAERQSSAEVCVWGGAHLSEPCNVPRLQQAQPWAGS